MTAEVEEVVCPRCKLHFRPEARHQAPQTSADHPTVLVIEDTEIFRQIARDALSENYRVETVDTAEAAHGFLGREVVHLIVLDLTLGEGDAGRRFLEALPMKPCPIVIFTARDESEMYGNEWEELQQLGADDVVLKGMNVGGVRCDARSGALLGGDPADEEA